MTLEQKVRYFKRSIAHDKFAIKFYRRIKTHRETYSIVRNQLKWHQQALKWHEELYKFYKAKINPISLGLPPHYSDWLCIHRYEGSWTDSGSPYYGGLQMDYGFMSSYGHKLLVAKGTANNWTPLEQMWVAEKAYDSGRGFYPWPNTARYCGLI